MPDESFFENIVRQYRSEPIESCIESSALVTDIKGHEGAITYSWIAAQLGIAPETFSRVLRQLREHGLIAGRGNVIDLPKPAALEVLAVG